MDYLTVKELVELKNCSAQYIKKLCKDGTIQAEVKPHPQNKQPCYMIPIASLSEELQAKYYKQKRTETGIMPETVESEQPVKESGLKYRSKGSKRAFDSFTAEEREIIRFWIDLLNEWQAERSKRKNKTEFDKIFVAHQKYINADINISPDILYRKYSAYKNECYEELIDKRGGWNKGKSKLADDSVIWQSFLIGNQSTDVGITKSAANMKKEAFAESLGNAFIYNKDNYPILFWEAGIPMLSIDKTTITLNELNQQETITPDTSYNGELVWESSNESVATVDENGVVTAVGNGNCTITLIAGGAKATCEVTVAYEYYLKESKLTMKPDLAVELKVYSKSNDEPTSLEVTYSSSNEDVAEVNKRGVISANAPGVAEIHAYIGGMDLVCVVTVEGVRGDINADGEFNISDAVILQKWLLAVPDVKLNNWKAGDLCEDDMLNVFDLCLMKRELVNK